MTALPFGIYTLDADAGVAEQVYAAASKAAGSQGPCGFESHPRHHRGNSYRPLSADFKLRAYIIGIALGDGNLTNPNGRAPRLRITCDPKYPHAIEKFRASLQVLLPGNRVSLINRSDGCIDVSCFSNHLEPLLGWKARKGSKIRQRARVPDWILADREYSIECLRGLIETDGSVDVDRGYPMVMFTTASPELGQDFAQMVTALGFRCRSYTLVNRYGYRPTSIILHVRVAKNAREFITLIAPQKP